MQPPSRRKRPHNRGNKILRADLVIDNHLYTGHQ
jgi:hypothetical protein